MIKVEKIKYQSLLVFVVDRNASVRCLGWCITFAPVVDQNFRKCFNILAWEHVGEHHHQFFRHKFTNVVHILHPAYGHWPESKPIAGQYREEINLLIGPRRLIWISGSQLTTKTKFDSIQFGNFEAKCFWIPRSCGDVFLFLVPNCLAC